MKLSDVQKAIKFTEKQEGFDHFQPPLDQQIRRENLTRLYWNKDVSGGMGQMFLACWTRIDVTP